MAVRPLELWNRWGIQILVLLSLTLHALLHPLAGVRRHQASSLPRALLWLVHQLATTTSIFAMGHLTLSSPARDRRLVAFWAPFLLLHQAGPDSISAYARQDSQLWLRHLKLLAVQALAAVYVLYRHLPRGKGSAAFLRLAAALMWVIGVVKYAEKVVALKRGTVDSIRSSVEQQPPVAHHHLHHSNHGQRHLKKQSQEEEEAHLRHAHHLFHVAKRAMVDSWLEKHPDHSTMTMLTALRAKDYRDAWVVAEMAASLLYDILYTKAGVVHTWPGYATRLATSSLAVPATLLLFFFHAVGQQGRQQYSKVDVAVSYALLAGAFLAEAASLLGALGSSWAYAFLSATRWSRLRYAALCTGRWDRLRRLLRGAYYVSTTNKRQWSGTMGQYNMLHFASRRGSTFTPLLGRLAGTVGFGELWSRKHYSTAVDVSDDLKHRLFEYLQRVSADKHGVVRKSWGLEALEAENDRDMYERLKRDGHLGVEFQEGVIIWHLATDIFLAKRNRDAGGSGLVRSIRMLSNYLAFLLVNHPDMLPGLPQTTAFRRTCDNLSDRCRATTQGHRSRSRNLRSSLREMLCLRDGPDMQDGRGEHQRHVDELASTVYREMPLQHNSPGSSPSPRQLRHASAVAEELLSREKTTQEGGEAVLKLLLNVWMDFLVYAAGRGSREAHAKKLGRGGELTTLVWIMNHFLSQEAYATGSPKV